MSLLGIVLTLLIVGFLLWVINNYVPIDGKIKGLINAFVVVVTVIWLLQISGLMGSLQDIRIR